MELMGMRKKNQCNVILVRIFIKSCDCEKGACMKILKLKFSFFFFPMIEETRRQDVALNCFVLSDL